MIKKIFIPYTKIFTRISPYPLAYFGNIIVHKGSEYQFDDFISVMMSVYLRTI